MPLNPVVKFNASSEAQPSNESRFRCGRCARYRPHCIGGRGGRAGSNELARLVARRTGRRRPGLRRRRTDQAAHVSSSRKPALTTGIPRSKCHHQKRGARNGYRCRVSITSNGNLETRAPFAGRHRNRHSLAAADRQLRRRLSSLYRGMCFGWAGNRSRHNYLEALLSLSGVRGIGEG
jgi:hypothetical protein